MVQNRCVSVIVIFLNEQRFLAEAIDSVLAQDFQEFELFLVDDGSTDGSTAIALEYAAREPSRIFYLEHAGHTNRGMSASRNLGLRAAHGKFVAFLDADDVWKPCKLAQQVCIMEEHPHLAMVCGAAEYWSSWAGAEDVVVPTGHLQDTIVFPPEASIRLYPLGTAPSPCPSDLLLRRDVAVSIGGFEEQFVGPLQLYEDQAFLAKLYLAAPVYFAGRVWLKYRLHPDSCMATVKENGRYDDVRSYFLLWLKEYLNTRPERACPQVVAALEDACALYR